ncbi:hypothetical protein GC722_09070 [Auraticoccus sp. F435]|uniref:Membrane protein YczE n=1 Tax=Auraticoccus cholistanensis TaxID=2656650 RepID=A0A6A9UTM1_9ACTN|nr:hypothetical protein [Auraticoccus cholistanensis]MVA76173.1 hypothetical protein [Auraticoccus cholistanensis]
MTTLGPLAQLRAGRLPRRLLQLGGGLAVYGVSLAMLVVSGLGSAPWDVLHLGVALHTGLSLGTVIVVVSVAVLLLWIPLRQRPGLGTVANALLVGVGVDLGLALLPDQPSLVLRVVLLVAGVLLNGAATALYIGAQLGPGPRDGLMTGLARRTGRSVRLVRTVLEVGVVLVGWVLGGPVGVGTVVYALAIGPVTQAVLPWVVVALPATAAGVTPRGAASRP